jgi:adenylosuccinate synthase
MPNLSVIGLQWGDEGKGKIVDYIADRFQAVARFNGGSNAGHTVVLGEDRHTFHLLPSGALKGKDLLIGAGVALDPVILAEELSVLPDAKARLLVDGRCTLVSPLDKLLDAVIEGMRGDFAIGTTMRGIGPSYAARALRLSPRVIDLFEGFDYAAMARFYEKLTVDAGSLLGWAEESEALLDGVVGSVSGRVMQINEMGGSVLFEGSQGTLLDLLHGSYPYVTSTNTGAAYVPAAMGIPLSAAGPSLGVVKCYTTRVGGGPFPTEVKDPLAESIRTAGNEIGATTGRPRRVGWLDLVALKYAIGLNGTKEIAVSKLDVLAQVHDFKACVAYRWQGTETTDFLSAIGHLGSVEPVYESPFSLRGANFEAGLPKEGRKLVDYLERNLNVRVRIVSFGEERSQTVEL